MAEWNRTTAWRQGHILTHEAAVALKVKPEESPEQTVAVVISHDCDLAADPAKEPNVELVIATLVGQPRGDLTFSKNARTLHLSFDCSQRKQWVELNATDKVAVPKSALVEFSPREDFQLDRSGRSTLQQWLAARYKRAAFPDAFEARLKESGLAERLTTIIKPHGKYIRAIFFDLDNGKDETRTDPGDTYALRIYVLYATEDDPEKAALVADEVCSKIEAAFQKRLLDASQKWTLIELCECSPISDEVFTIAQSHISQEWRLEHLSLRQDPPQPMLTG